MDVLERVAELRRSGIDIVRLEIGEPDFDTPLCIVEAGERALREGKTRYTHSLGLMELREAVSEHYSERYDVRVSPEQVIITAGTSPALLLLYFALLEGGDEVIISDPHYPCYPNIIRFCGGRCVLVGVKEEDSFQYRPEAVAAARTARTRAVMINSPSNPTGTLLPFDRMQAIANLGVPVVSDEIYHGLVYGAEEHSILEATDDAFVLSGFSKAYAMTGWRLGYLIVPPKFVRPIQKMQQNFFISAPAAAQHAGIAALRQAAGDVERMREIYNKRRRFMIRRLRELGFGVAAEPQGAFYVLANAKRFSTDSYRLAFDILEHAHVAVAPGVDFGRRAEGYLRFSYANSLENIEEGLKRIERYLGSHRGDQV